MSSPCALLSSTRCRRHCSGCTCGGCSCTSRHACSPATAATRAAYSNRSALSSSPHCRNERQPAALNANHHNAASQAAHLLHPSRMCRVHASDRALRRVSRRVESRALLHEVACWLTCKLASAALASQTLRRAEHRELAVHVTTHGCAQLRAAAADAAAAADRRALSNSSTFEAEAESGTRQSREPGVGRGEEGGRDDAAKGNNGCNRGQRSVSGVEAPMAAFAGQGAAAAAMGTPEVA